MLASSCTGPRLHIENPERHRVFVDGRLDASETLPDAAAAACERAMQRAGLAAETRKYKPHVTLAYCNGTLDIDVANFLQDAAAFRTDPFWVDHFCMYSSRATKAGSRYVEEAVYPLAGAG